MKNITFVKHNNFISHMLSLWIAVVSLFDALVTIVSLGFLSSSFHIDLLIMKLYRDIKINKKKKVIKLISISSYN